MDYKNLVSKLFEADEKDGDEYKAFFQKALKKFGVTEPDKLEGSKKKEFYDYIDKNWKSDKEKSGDMTEGTGIVKWKRKFKGKDGKLETEYRETPSGERPKGIGWESVKVGQTTIKESAYTDLMKSYSREEYDKKKEANYRAYNEKMKKMIGSLKKDYPFIKVEEIIKNGNGYKLTDTRGKDGYALASMLEALYVRNGSLFWAETNYYINVSGDKKSVILVSTEVKDKQLDMKWANIWKKPMKESTNPNSLTYTDELSEVYKNIKYKINEKTLSDKEIQDMIDLIADHTKDAESGSGAEIKKMLQGIRASAKDGLSPAQVGWLMKTAKGVS